MHLDTARFLDTLWGYMPHRPADHRGQLNRLRRVRGQVDGVIRMVEDNRYCPDIVVQTRAARNALLKLEHELLRGHVQHCVKDAVHGRSDKDPNAVLDELMEVLGRFGS